MAKREFVPPPIHGRPSFREHIDRGTFPAHGHRRRTRPTSCCTPA